MDSDKKDYNPDMPLQTAERLLNEGNPNLAMAYFVHAGDGFVEKMNWEKAGYSYSMAAYCYEIDGRIDDAVKDYEQSAILFERGGLIDEAEKSRARAAALLIIGK